MRVTVSQPRIRPCHILTMTQLRGERHTRCVARPRTLSLQEVQKLQNQKPLHQTWTRNVKGQPVLA